MSVKAVSWVFDHSPYTLGARLVHLALADIANEDHGWQVWVSKSKIAEKAKVSRGTVTSTLAKMVSDGYLEVVGMQAKGVTTYRFLRPKDDLSDSDRCAIDGVGPAQSVDPAPLLLNQIEPKTARAQARDLTGFDAFWDAYPSRHGKKERRSQAVDQWVKLSIEDRRAAWRAALNYACACQEEQTIAADAFRWLRDRRWGDWQEAAEYNPPQASVTETAGPLEWVPPEDQ